MSKWMFSALAAALGSLACAGSDERAEIEDEALGKLEAKLASAECGWVLGGDDEHGFCVSSGCSDGCWALDCVWSDGSETHEIAESCNAQ